MSDNYGLLNNRIAQLSGKESQIGVQREGRRMVWEGRGRR